MQRHQTVFPWAWAAMAGGLLLALATPALAQAPGREPPPIPVTLATVDSQPWQSTVSAIGFLQSFRGVDVAPAVGGLVTEILFDSGQPVTVGQPMVRLDTTIERTQLLVSRAELPNARANLDRARELIQRGAGTQARVDEAQSNFDRVNAQIANLQATIDRRVINAPFAGVLGLRKIDLGQYLQPGTVIVNLQDLTAMRIEFIVPQRELARIRTGLPVGIQVDAYPGRDYLGTITAIEPQVNAQSGVVQVEATIPNAEGLLRPGMFATVEVRLAEVREVIALPVSAVTFSLYGESVFLAKPGQNGALVAQRQAVRTGPRRGNLVVIEDGVAPGDQVVTFGQIRLNNGARLVAAPGGAPTLPARPPVQ